MALYWGCCCLLVEASSMEEQPSAQLEDLILLTIPAGGPTVVVTKPNQLMRIIWDKICLTVDGFGSVSKASYWFRFGSEKWLSVTSLCQATNISIWVFGMNNQSNHQTNWLHFRHFQLKKYLAVGGGGGGVGGGKNSLNHKITIYIYIYFFFLGVYWA